MSDRLTPSHLSAAAGTLPGDPGVDDWGVPAAVAGRCEAAISGSPVYQGARAQAAAAFHTLIRLPMLEHSNARFATLIAIGILDHHAVTPPTDWSAWAKLASTVEAGTARVSDVHQAITDWTS
ncbi:fic family toxin-antitoxin system, toxin component [Streptomyces sp. TR02-1]|uniref:fic family toxin-antitoxin system, toxin component n=1 Tax=Streptomyces sp. TR02-1 TaxID=3385977 RepID=UPI0039A29B16